MYCNTSATLYSIQQDGSYKRTVLDGVFWDENRISIFKKTGVMNSNKGFLLIPYIEGLSFTTGKDRIVKGEVEFEATTENTITELVRDYDNVLLVTEVDLKDAGSESMWHWEVGGNNGRRSQI